MNVNLIFRGTVSLLLAAYISACAGASPPARVAPLIPSSNTANFQVEEYPLVEQSTDNPTHPGFQKHVPQAVIDQRAAWRVPTPQNAILVPNRLLQPFGVRLDTNPTPPFRAYALYQGDELLQADILHFWPVTLSETGDDFLLPFETFDGQRLVLSNSGLEAWPGEESSQTSAPVYLGNQLAYASTAGGMLSVYAGGSTVFTADSDDAPAEASPHALFDLGDGHWALQMDGRVILDGKELNQIQQYQDVFHLQTIQGNPFYFFTQGGVTKMSYAGQTLPFVYDQVVHGGQGTSAMFSPGGNEYMVWFYALRDGLWYYVEAGVFE